MHLSPPCQHGLVSNGNSHLVMDPSDVAHRVVECNLRVVWRGSQRVNLSLCMTCMYVTVKCGGIVGGGGTLKQFLLMCLFIVSLIIYNRILKSYILFISNKGTYCQIYWQVLKGFIKLLAESSDQ
jgi:hypothetical protein